MPKRRTSSSLGGYLSYNDNREEAEECYPDCGSKSASASASVSVRRGTSVSSTRDLRRSRSKTPTGNKHQRRVRRSKSPGVKETVRESIKRRCSFDEAYERHRDNDDFQEDVQRCIPATFFMLASQDEVSQSQEDYFAMEKYILPKLPGKLSGKAGSVATCALLELMHENPQKFVCPNNNLMEGPKDKHSMSCYDVLQQIPARIKRASKLTAKPTISSSRPLGPPRSVRNGYAPFSLVPSHHEKGSRRALLVGVVTTPSGPRGGKGKPLQSPPNDIAHMKHFLVRHAGFKAKDITVLLEDGTSGKQPTRKNIMAGFHKLVELSQPNDVCFVQFSGHGGRSSHNIHLVPSDFTKSGPVRDEDIMNHLIKAMPNGVHTNLLIDCCYSGTMGDLPYVLQSGATKQKIEVYFDTYTCQEVLDWERQHGDPTYEEEQDNRATQRLLKLNATKQVPEGTDTTASLSSDSNHSLKLSSHGSVEDDNMSSSQVSRRSRKGSSLTRRVKRTLSGGGRSSRRQSSSASQQRLGDYFDENDDDNNNNMDKSVSSLTSSKRGSSVRRKIKRTFSGGSRQRRPSNRYDPDRTQRTSHRSKHEQQDEEGSLSDDMDKSKSQMSSNRKRSSSITRRVKRTLSSGPRYRRSSTTVGETEPSDHKKELPRRSNSFSGRMKRSLSSSGLARKPRSSRANDMDASSKSVSEKPRSSRDMDASVSELSESKHKTMSKRNQLRKKLTKKGSSSRLSGMDDSKSEMGCSQSSRGSTRRSSKSSRRPSRSGGLERDESASELDVSNSQMSQSTSKSSLRRRVKRTLSGGLSRRSSRRSSTQRDTNDDDSFAGADMDMSSSQVSNRKRSSSITRRVKRTLSSGARYRRSSTTATDAAPEKKELPKRSNSFSGRIKRTLSSSSLHARRRNSMAPTQETTTKKSVKFSADDDIPAPSKKATSPKRQTRKNQRKAQDEEDKARKEAVERSKREAAQARASKKKAAEDLEEAARKEAVERSRAEAQAARAAARRESVERSRRETAGSKAKNSTGRR